MTMIETITRLDTSIFLFFNGLWSAKLDTAIYYLSNTFTWIPLYLLVIALIIRKWKKKSIAILLFLALTVLVNDQTCNYLKRTIGRIRPSHRVELEGEIHLVEKPDGKIYRGGRFSFPSGHASNSIILVWYFIYFVRPRRKGTVAAMAAWSLLMAYTRLYLGVHYPLDLLAGFILGTFFSLLFIKMAMRAATHGSSP